MAYLAGFVPYAGLYLYSQQAQQMRKMGKEQEAQGIMQSIQSERNALASQAEAQREAIEEKRKAKFAMSRAKAVAAASGAGGSDPTVENILDDMENEGEYRALSALYSGDTDANLARAQAGIYRNEGRAKRRSANLNADSTMLQGALNFAGKYG